MRIRTISVALIFMVIAPLLHAACDLNHRDECKISELRLKTQQAAKLKEKTATDAAEKKVGNENRATTAPDPFASRLHNSYQDFVAPFSFAINKIEESKDGRAVIVRFNTLRHEGVKLGFTGTAAKPTLFAGIAEGIPEVQRDDVVGKLGGKLKDFDDVTLAASLAFEKKVCDPSTSFCFGRNPQTYRQALATQLKPLLEEAAILASDRSSEAGDLEFQTFLNNKGLSDQVVLGTITDKALHDEILRRIHEQVLLDSAASAKAIEFLNKAGITNLATLLDNQPQLAFTGSWRNVGDLGGPDELATTVEFQYGANNLNNAGSKLLDILKDDPVKQPSDKVVFTASYKRSMHYKFASLSGTGVSLASGTFTPVDVPRTSDWQAKAQWGRRLGVAMDKEQQPRFDLSAEFQRNGKGGIRTKNRVVATATVTVPLREDMSFPISLKYANKPEFLEGTRKDLSMHFGISYRFPWEPKPQ